MIVAVPRQAQRDQQHRVLVVRRRRPHRARLPRQAPRTRAARARARQGTLLDFFTHFLLHFQITIGNFENKYLLFCVSKTDR